MDTMPLSARLADGIIDIIRADKLSSGDSIPSVRALAERFEVTTPTVREALRRLEATGAVEFRHGSGTYVGPMFGSNVLPNPHPVPITRETLIELVEARMVIEPGVALAAARNADPQSLERLDAAVATALTPPSAKPATLNFHIELAAASGNRLVHQTVKALLHTRTAERKGIRTLYDDRQGDHAEHLAIATAVREGDADAAEALTLTHLGRIRDAIIAAPASELS